MLIGMLGGNAEPAPPGFPQAGAPYPIPQGPYPNAPQAPQGQQWTPPGVPAEAWAPPVAPQGYAPQTPVTPSTPIQQAIPREPAPPVEPADEGMTQAMGGVNLQKLRVPTEQLTLQILDRGGQWHTWAKISASGLKIGRSEKTNQFPELNSMATRHMRLTDERGKVRVEDLGALNGVYLRIHQPYQLEDGMRFRVGGQVIEFRAAVPLDEVEPLRTEDNEEFWSRDLNPLAYLEFIRPDNSPGPRYPITKRDQTVLGRESRLGKPIDIALPNDEWVSGQHAQVRFDDGAFFLEDLASRNGTFVRISGTTLIEPGDVLLVGRVLFRVVHQT
jgi:pSer/pThr/pTyr-binding forkhead associated (FHA) protein